MSLCRLGVSILSLGHLWISICSLCRLWISICSLCRLWASHCSFFSLMPLGCAAVFARPRPRLRHLSEAMFFVLTSFRMTLVIHELAPYEQVCVVVVVCRPHPQDTSSGPHTPQWKHHLTICFFDLACHEATVDALLL